MTDARRVKEQDAAADLVASVLLHCVPNLDNYTVLDALLEATVLPDQRTVILAAWHRAKVRRELDARGLVLPDYSLPASPTL